MEKKGRADTATRRELEPRNVSRCLKLLWTTAFKTYIGSSQHHSQPIGNEYSDPSYVNQLFLASKYFQVE